MSSKNPWDNSDDNDPWSKKKNTSEDILKSFKTMFGEGGDDKIAPSFHQILWIFLIIFILYLLSGFRQVEHDERGVVLRFGKCIGTVGPGLRYVFPYPFEALIVQRVTTVNQIDIGFKNTGDENLMLTGDSNLANISFSVLWKIKENGLEDYLFNAKSPQLTIQAVAESVMREVVGQTQFTYVQTEGRADIQNKVRESLQALVDEYKMGVDIIRVELQRVEPPVGVIDSFRDVERAQAEQQSEKNKADAYDRDTRARTRGLIAEKLNHGQAQKQAIIQTAKGAVARFLSMHSQYKLAPEIVSKRLYIDTMRDIYKDVNKIIIDKKAQTFSHFAISELQKKIKEPVNE